MMGKRLSCAATVWTLLAGVALSAQQRPAAFRPSPVWAAAVDLIFADDFESGDPLAWTAVLGYAPPIPANTSCDTAVNLGVVTDNDCCGAIEASAIHQLIPVATSRWYRVLAEDPPGDDWKLLAKISNITAGANLDLFAYRRADGNSCGSSPTVPSGTCNQNISGCGGSQENSNRCSQNASNGDECVSWFEGCTGFLEDDQTVVWIEVRHAAGSAASFDLRIRNNGNNDSLTCATF